MASPLSTKSSSYELAAMASSIPPADDFQKKDLDADTITCVANTNTVDESWDEFLVDVIGCDDAAIEMISNMEQGSGTTLREQRNLSPTTIQNNHFGSSFSHLDHAPSYSWNRPRNGHFARSTVQHHNHNKVQSSIPHSKPQHPHQCHYRRPSFEAPDYNYSIMYQADMSRSSHGHEHEVPNFPAESPDEKFCSGGTVSAHENALNDVTLTFTSFRAGAFAPLSPTSQVSLCSSAAPSLTNSDSEQIPPCPVVFPSKITEPSKPIVGRSASYGGPGKCLSILHEHRRQQEESERERVRKAQEDKECLRKEQEAEERERMRKAQEAAALAFAHKRAVAIAAQKVQSKSNNGTNALPSKLGASVNSIAVISSDVGKESAPVKVIKSFKDLRKGDFDFHGGAADKTYYDFSNITEDEQALPAEERNTGGVVAPFPLRLHDMLHQNKFPDVVTWAPHGRAFIVHKPKEFEARVLCRYFNQTKYRSFQRQLNLYGFRRMNGVSDADRGAYYHELFLRGRRKLCTRMKRKAVKGTVSRAIFEPELEPNFYAMSPLHDDGPDNVSIKPAAVQTPSVSSLPITRLAKDN